MTINATLRVKIENDVVVFKLSFSNELVKQLFYSVNTDMVLIQIAWSVVGMSTLVVSV